MKLFKLIVHQKNFSSEDLIINPKDFPTVKKGDIVEIFHPEDEFSRLLLQITSFKEDLQTREAVSVEQTIASTFQLRTYADVYMNVVNPESVALDSIELTFKDQYMGRSEMWRLKNSLLNTCVYLNKKIEFCGGSIRCQVHEMWSQGDRVACGVIAEDTKIVFRSNTSMVYLFIQMSSEMWDCDINGDLYFEKAVNGFLSDLFQKWKKNGCYHEVTIVLFSRTFYEAQDLEKFPIYMRECLQQDYKGRFYEDFYRVVVQNERYDEWTSTLVQLRKLFTEYHTKVVEYHKRDGIEIPRAVNSTAAQGNFLEVLNMSLNVFEKHYLDRSFDRTGQLSVVITPGVGVFEVDRELTNVTKQRIIDNGVGSDLVCVGEQPLHAVPLLKFHNKDSINAVDDYSMPHWINLSFYSTNKKIGHSNFTPRIKLPPKKPSPIIAQDLVKQKLIQDEETLPNSVFDYDAYDAQVFQLPTFPASRLSRGDLKTIGKIIYKKGSVTVDGPDPHKISRKLSDPDIHHMLADSSASPHTASSINSTSLSIGIGLTSSSSIKQIKPQMSQDLSLSDGDRHIAGSAGSSLTPTQTLMPLRCGRGLINPFDPSHVTIKLTSNRRRWTHIFPKGPTGVLIQQHHYQAVPAQVSNDTSYHLGSSSDLPTASSTSNLNDGVKRNRGVSLSAEPPAKGNKALLWGATGEQEWTPALTTGVDWKSLTIPACLPITTDYFPDKRSLQYDYLLSDYDLLPDDVNADFAQHRAVYKKPLTTKEVFKELVSQRLAQGFQLIVLPNLNKESQNTQGKSLVRSHHATNNLEPSEEYLLSIGRIFHKISLSGSSITVTRYRPRHPYPPFNIHYQYRFQAPDHPTYEMSRVSFTTEKLENYSWNFLDHYICTRGDTDFPLAENLKYWRFRIYLLPLSWNATVTKKIMEGSKHCDMYTWTTVQEQTTLLESFLRYIETGINKIKRPNVCKKPRIYFDNRTLKLSNKIRESPPLGTYLYGRRRHSTGIIALAHNTNSQSGGIGNSPFRDRLGSIRLLDRQRPNLKAIERGKISSTSDNFSSPDNFNFDSETNEDSQGNSEPTKLKNTSSLAEILEAMTHGTSNHPFFVQHPSLPSMTFTSADAVQWLIQHVEGVENGDDAIAIMEKMLKEKKICHASGDFSLPFIVGYYLYHVCVNVADSKDSDYSPPLHDLHSFENEWVEIEIQHPNNWRQNFENKTAETTVPKFLNDILEDKCQDDQEQSSRDWKTPMYKQVHLEIDVNNKSDRIEWGHCRYQSFYRPDRAFELVIQWMAASGTIVADLISGWARKSQACGIQMIPLPGDPLSLPFNDRSDPLRGPLFVPLDTECLMGNKSYLFQDFPESSWDARLVLLQEAIVQRFGFIACVVESRKSVRASYRNLYNHHHQYVHVTGNMFILIPSTPCSKLKERMVQNSISVGSRSFDHHQQSSRKYPIQSDVACSPHEEYITRHVYGNKKAYNESDSRPGFLWFWNHMVSRRWKCSSTPATGDEVFQNKILEDFRQFCSNQDNRLKSFWDESYEKFQKYKNEVNRRI
ncbi:DEP domain-containing protein, putative [Pediculus humanus corporis]|uniref:DEP domain-containing protein, putative n=1 Tax=Pediculus humanus subsp. corporis TaxID=121224 RepID=E0VTF7_PEDHC|nr:DEP domain-containing protein, putative [Pediculus humanus corporis]EEB16663.1 DEP domain-containing protein, putative [Pediculus humanus corporis]